MKSSQSNSSLKSKLLSYAAVGTTFLMTSGEDAKAQCGVVNQLNPTLVIDMDNDGTADVTVNGFFSTFYTNQFTYYNLLSTFFGGGINSYVFSTYLSGINNYFGCTNGILPNRGTLNYNFGPAAISGTLTIPASFYYYAIGYYAVYQQYDVDFENIFFNAQAQGSNRIVSISQSFANNYSVCNIFGTTNGLSIGNVYASIGNEYKLNLERKNYYYFIYSRVISESAFVTVAPSIFPQSVCETSSFATFGVDFPPAYPYFFKPFNSYGNAGGFTFAGSNVFTSLSTSYLNLDNHFIGVKFQSSGETHYGWLELEYDAISNTLTCVGKGYNSCSIEDATAQTTATNACIAFGQSDPSLNCCIADLTITSYANIANLDYKAGNSITANVDAPLGTMLIDMTAGNEINLIPGFGVNAATDFSAEIEDCP